MTHQVAAVHEYGHLLVLWCACGWHVSSRMPATTDPQELRALQAAFQEHEIRARAGKKARETAKRREAERVGS